MIEPTGSGTPGRPATPAPPSELLAEVAALSRHFGSDPAYTRGGGGNSSGKADGVLYIKPSGVSLATLTPRSLMPLTMEPLLAVLDGSTAAAPPGSEEVLRMGMAARLDPADHRRPSVELVFHALLPERIVIHTHPTTVNALTCAARGPELAADLFGDDALWIPYTNPGLPLACRIADARHAHEQRTGHRPPPVILLQNHGLIVAGSGTQEIIERSAVVVAAIRELIKGSDPLPAPDVAAPDAAVVQVVADAIANEMATAGAPVVVAADTSAAALRVGATAAGRAFVGGGPLTPDQIVYAGSWPLLIEAGPAGVGSGGRGFAEALHARLAEHVAATDERPAIFVVEGIGVFAVATSTDLAATVRDVYLDAIRVGEGATRLGGIRPLAPEERHFIQEWEAEAYRLGVAAAGDMRSGDPRPGGR